jgi:hypothetical protein
MKEYYDFAGWAGFMGLGLATFREQFSNYGKRPTSNQLKKAFTPYTYYYLSSHG